MEFPVRELVAHFCICGAEAAEEEYCVGGWKEMTCHVIAFFVAVFLIDLIRFVFVFVDGFQSVRVIGMASELELVACWMVGFVAGVAIKVCFIVAISNVIHLHFWTGENGVLEVGIPCAGD